MKSLQTGFAPVAPTVREIAEQLLESFPTDVTLLLGVSLAKPPLPLDLVAVTPTVVVVGIDSARQGPVTPQQAGQQVATLQQAAMPYPLPVYVCWLGPAPPPGQEGTTPALPDAIRVERYILQAASQHTPAGPQAAGRLIEMLLSEEKAPPGGIDTRTPPLRRAFRALGEKLDTGLLEQLTPLRFGRRGRAVRPADINRNLEAALFDRQNLLEDVNYGKIVPNEFLVEVGAENYEQRFRPIAEDLSRQWERRLLAAVNTANGRQGGRYYRFGGPVIVHLRPAADLPADEVRIRSRVNNEQEVAAATGTPCLQRLPQGRTWALQEAHVTMGRSRENDIYLDDPAIQERRLISSQHAYLRCEGERCQIFDGSPGGKASLNGTFVNGEPVGTGGRLLRDGDVIVLAATDPRRPRPDAPGTAAFVFRTRCERGS